MPKYSIEDQGETIMPQRNLLGIAIVLSVIALGLTAWPTGPALAGLTPTPPPPSPTPITPTDTPVAPTNTPIAPTNTPQPPPEKPPRDTPIPTATVGLTATPGMLPITGEQASHQERSEIIQLAIASALILGAVSIIFGRMART